MQDATRERFARTAEALACDADRRGRGGFADAAV
jgi:hypothetical protein